MRKRIFFILFLIGILQVSCQPSTNPYTKEVTPERSYFQPGDVFTVFVQYNRTDASYIMIELGPHLALIGTRYEERVIVTPEDPNVTWSIMVLDPRVEVADTYYELKLADLETMNITYLERTEIVIVNVEPLIKILDDLQNQINRLNAKISVLQDQNRELNTSLVEARRKLADYMDGYLTLQEALVGYKPVRIQPTNVSVKIAGKKVWIVIKIPYYWDPLRNEWVKPREEDIMIKNNIPYFRFPWTRDWGDAGWITAEEARDPLNLRFVYAMLNWYHIRTQATAHELGTWRSWSFFLPLAIAFLVLIGIAVISFLRLRYYKRLLERHARGAPLW